MAWRWLALLVPVAGALGADSTERAALAILEKNCWSCHGPARTSGLDLRDRQALLRGGSRGPAVVPGDAAQSLLYRAVARSGELKMPPGQDPLAAAEVETLGRWINQGATWDSSAGGGAEPTWWAFRKPLRPRVPGPAHPIDAFLDQKRREKGLQPAPQADQRTLVRRAWFDLHGLPPSPDQVEAFINDSSPQAWPKLIDRLLESPRYGERWGRHWLDVVRYADTGGFETDIYFPNAWRYRDYVIRSFNEDKPYNRFVEEQIAGDELWPDNLDLEGGYGIPAEKRKHLEARIGTGLYTFGPVEHEAALNGEKLRHEWLSEAVDVTGAAFLGLTLACARCHDHKFDPIPQRDYYRLQAIFAGSEQREVPVVDMMAVFGYYTAYPRVIAAEQLKAAVNRVDQKARQRAIEALQKKFPPETVTAFDTPKEKRSERQKELAYELEVAVKALGTADLDGALTEQERQERRGLIQKLGEAYLKAPNRFATATVLGRAEIPPEVHVALRGDLGAKGEKIRPGLPAALSDGRALEGERRKALALWLTDPDHPLTARVIVNRIWQGHFGRGIVATANDFGRQGEAPTHPELLDWLAREFVERGWSIKAMHRLVMTSQAYQMDSRFQSEPNARLDPANRYQWRMNRRRLEAETLRDAILAASGGLNLKTGGPPVVPPLSAEEMEGMWNPGQWPVSSDLEEHRRRSVYLYVKRSFRYPMFETFDQPDTSVSCARRETTTVPPQALALLNHRFVHEEARRLAARLAGRPEAIETAWRAALGRPPVAEELRKSSEFLAGDPRQGLEQLCLLLFNLNEFVYVD